VRSSSAGRRTRPFGVIPAVRRSFAVAWLAVGSALIAVACARGEPPTTGATDAPTPALSAAERLARWQQQTPREPIPAAVTFERELTFEEVHDFLQRQGLVPFSLHMRIEGAAFAPRSAPERASVAELGRAREQALDHVLQTLCAHGGIEARLSPRVARDAASQAALERAMLTRVELSRWSRSELREGAPLIYGVNVVSAVAAIGRLGGDQIVRRVEPWVRMTIGDVERLVGPDPQMPGAGGPVDRLDWIEALDPAEVRARLGEAMREPPSECPAWLERQEEIRRDAARMRQLLPPDTLLPSP
jgi:hypothetical protein